MTATAAHGQLSVAPQPDLVELARSIAGPGVRITNPVLDCHGLGHGTFSYTGAMLNTPEGVLLTTGSITNALGPNNAENTTFEQFHPGSTLLTTMTGRSTFDACHLEFDLIPAGDTLRMNYVFASEEYPEWVGSQFNDVFGIFISGPGIAGDPGLGGDKNLALVPNSTTPVMINTVNAGSNNAYFQNNTGGSQLQYDGLTKHLQAVSAVQPCGTYRMKMVIADVADRLYDSGLFIAPIQSNAVSMTAFGAHGLDHAVEGCAPGTIRFTRPASLPIPQQVHFYLGGTAINGVDYPLIGANANPNTLHTAVIPAGQSSVDILFNALADGVAEGTEIVRVHLGSPACPGLRLDSIDLPINDLLPLIISPSVAICAGQSTSLQASGAQSYTWTPSLGLSDTASPTPIASPTTSTTYTVTGSAGTCSASQSTTITVSNMVLSALITRPLCLGQSNGILNLSVAGGVQPIVFSWAGPNGFTATTEDLVNIASGTYTVTATDATGCTRVQSFNVNAPDQLSATLVPTILPFGQNISCHGGNDGAIDMTVTGGTAPYALSWSGPNGFSSYAQDISGLHAGTYTVNVVDQNGCSTMGSMLLSQPPALLPSIASFMPVTCHGAANGTATATVSGGIPPYTFTWNTTPVQNGPTATGLTPGIHTVTVTDGYGCSESTFVTIAQPQVLNVALSALGNVIHCQGQSQQHGTATAVPSGGTAPYNFHWNTIPVQTTATATFQSGGNYTVTVTDANNCTSSASFTVDQPGSPTTTIVQQSNVSCVGDNSGSATIAISGGGNVQSVTWNTTPPQSGFTTNNLPPGTWTATAIHANGCQTQVQVTIAGPTELLAANIPAVAGIASPSCTGAADGSATVNVSGGGTPYTYAWNTSPAQQTATATGLQAGTYTVVVTDAYGCSTTASAAISDPAPLSATITGYTNVLCFGSTQGTASAQAGGGAPPYLYSWNSTPVQSGPNATDLPAGSYTVTVTDANGCVATTDVTIGGPQFGIYAFIEEVGNVTCVGADNGHATVGATGGSNSFTFTWNTTPPASGPTITGLAPGNYTVEVVDNNGCDSPKFLLVTILGPSSPLAISLDVTNASCSTAGNGAIDLSISGGEAPYTHTWTDADGNNTGIEDLTGLSPGVYLLSLQDSYGCTLDTSITVQATNLLQASINTVQVPCSAGSNGELWAQVQDGAAPYTYAWIGPDGFNANTAFITGLAEGSYGLTIGDGNGCTATASAMLTGTPPPTLDLFAPVHPGATNISCAGGSDGSVSLTIQGGTAPFAIQWSDGLGFTSDLMELTGLPAGIYQATVTDDNGCQVSGQVELTAPQPIDLAANLSNYNGVQVSCASASDGSIDLQLSGGVAPYAIAWSNGSTTQVLSDLGEGTISVIVTDINGCEATGTWALNAPDTISTVITAVLKPGGTGVSCEGITDGELIASVEGGTAPYTLAWTGPAGYTADGTHLTGLASGTYQLIVTDGNGCTSLAQTVITAPATMSIALNSITYNGGHHIPCAGGAAGTITASVAGASSEHTLSWTGPNGYNANGPAQSGLIAGTYQVTLTDAFGCSTTNTLELVEPQPLEAVLTISDAGYGYAIGCAGNDGTTSAIITGGTPSYQFDWTGPNGFASLETDLTGLGAGNYHLTVTDANGCTIETNALLVAPPPIGILLEPAASPCPGDGTGSISTTITGGAGDMTFAWTGPNGFSSSNSSPSGLGDGPYTVMVTDAMGCAQVANTLIESPQTITAGAYVAQYGSYNLQCLGDSSGVIELTPAGGTAPYSITLSGPTGFGGVGAIHAGLIAGSYVVSIGDSNGCVLDTMITLIAPEQNIDVALTLSTYPSGTNVSCHGASDGWIQANVDGEGPFTFVWRGPDSLEFNTPDIYGLVAGNYTYELVVTDANGCTFSTEVNLTEPDTTISASTLTSLYNGGYAVSCHNAADGWIDLTVVGGNGGFSMSWSGPEGFQSNDEDLANVTAGTYVVTITDMNGCALPHSVELDAPEALINDLAFAPYPGGTAISCAGAADGSINATTGGGVPGMLLAWTGPNGPFTGGTIINDLGPGTYCLTVNDANGCALETCLELIDPAALTTMASALDAPCGGPTGSVSATVSGGTAPFGMLWNTGASTPDLQGIVPGTYSVIVTDANGCQSSSTATVVGNDALMLEAQLQDVTCHAGNNGTLALTVSGGTSPLDHVWEHGATTSTLSDLEAGTYTVFITDANGCTASGSWTIAAPEPITILATPYTYPNGHNLSAWDADDGRITTVVAGGTPSYSFSWSNGSSTTNLTGLQAGSYALTVTDANGCTATVILELSQPSDLAMPTGFSPNGDGANDLFHILGLEAYPSNTFVVFNRWGNVVYDRLNYRNDWNGENTEGQPLPDGTYFVILSVSEGTRSMQGYVDLRR